MREPVVPDKRSKVTPGRRRAVYDRAKGLCVDCGADLSSVSWDIDHVVPIWLGGSDKLVNMEARCVPCHRIKTLADVARIAKTKRQMQMATPKSAPKMRSARRIPSRPFPKRSPK